MKLKNTCVRTAENITIVEIVFSFQGVEKTIWFEDDGKNLTVDNSANAFLSLALLPAMLVGEDIDITNHEVSRELLNNVDTIQSTYLRWFPELNLRRVSVFSSKIQKVVPLTGSSVTASFFSGGVDSFDTVLALENDRIDAGIDVLLYVYGYDVRFGDVDLFQKTRRSLDMTSKELGKELICISTNLREFTEPLVSWDFIHGAALIAVAHVCSGTISRLYIPASNSIGQLTPNGSHPDLDPLFKTETLDIVHYGIERTRIEKILQNIAHSEVALQNLKVCWKNSGDTINCGTCEKCLRTMVALEIAGVLQKAPTFPSKLPVNLLPSIVIQNEGVANLYRELLPYLKRSAEWKKLHDVISLLLHDFDKKVAALSQKGEEYTKSNGFVAKKKSVLFVDFNGVVSYNPFWHSLRNKEHPLHVYMEQIENYLFKDAIEIVMDWMIGKHTSEEIHRLLEREIGVPYDTLFPLFCDECSHIDISHRILEHIQELRQWYHCVLITDNMDSFDRFTLPNNPMLYTVFNEIHNSYTMKRFKKSDEGAYFKEVVERQGAIFQNSILIDDSKNNCALFESLGGCACISKTEDQAISILTKLKERVARKWEWQY